MRPETTLACIGLALLACGGRVEGSAAPSGNVDGGAEATGLGPSDGAALTDGSSDSTSDDGRVTGPLDSSSGIDATNGCVPLPGCTSSTSCEDTDGCNTCACEQGLWQCTGYACPGDAADHDQGCPPISAPPYDGLACTQDIVCTYPSACLLEWCACEGGAWTCHLVTQNCDGVAPGDSCPGEEPAPGAACPTSGTTCEYATCPGAISTYFDTNCLCVDGRWDCATFRSCDAGAE